MLDSTLSPRHRTRRLVLTGLALLAALAAVLFAISTSGGESRAATDPDASGPAVATWVPKEALPLARAERQAAALTRDQLIGQRIIAGVPGTEIPAGLRRMVRRGEIAGVILFADNFPNRDAGRRLIRRLQRIPRPRHLRTPLLVMIDQEGGLVKRVSGAPQASAAEMGRRGAAYSRRQGRLTGRNLRNVGVNVDLAPVLDVARPGGDIFATHRGFGSTVNAVRRTAVPFAEGLQAAGVAATAKHFPGLGAISRNTDFAAQTVTLSKAALRKVDEAPYRDFIDAGGKLVMLGTAVYPAFSNRPAAFSRQLAYTELRRRLGFKGVTITDAMGTVAVSEFGGPRKAALAGARAGMDLLLYTDWQSARRAHRILRSGWASRWMEREHFLEAATRVLALRTSLR